ncbi:hypothetical protein SKAU_G00427120 [Synaphobranchus kaupii]|uniref:Ig-like domain-containing protein n=1 Tax=Synaphobranchus kaupii TaxID=118154 RepID=A0A9Q1E4U3_SYNKA|nr:hypothetical protein SKAU_G00427120 [Synaphobranchus kaupii]
MSSKNIILILLLITFATVKLGEQADCDYQARGGSITFKLDYNGPPKDHSKTLTWKKNGQTIFERKKNTLRTGKESDITSDGSLLLKDLKASDNGEYLGETFNSAGKSHKSKEKKICVIERVTKPTVHLDCEKNTLTCHIESKTQVKISWKENKNVLQSKTRNTILFEPEKKYSCTIKNDVSEETSNEIEINCSDRTLGPGKTLFGLDFWIMILILAVGGSLLLILVLVTVVCICRRRRHKQTLVRDEEELRLANLTHSPQPHPPGHHHHQAPPPKSHSGDQPPALPKPRGHNRPRAPHPAGPAQGQEHLPPRPKPRKGPRPPRS